MGRCSLPTLLALLAGCSTLDYYAHLAQGQYALLAAREPIAKLVAAPSTDEALRAKLKLALEARTFASKSLALPDNGSYTDYADVGRPWVLKNLFAAKEFSLAPVEQCVPIAGCVAYRGYYDDRRAQAEAERLKREGYEVYIGDVPAYSTLGWFDDPVMNTMLRWDDDELVGIIFHELAHQRLYLPGDTAFNESFASFVEHEGLRRWQAARGLPAAGNARSVRAEQFTALMLRLRERLQAIYDGGQPDDAKRQAKAQAIETMREEYRALRDGEWQGYSGYDEFVNGEINNAKLLPFGLYHALIPGFARLFVAAGDDFPAFYAAAETLSKADPDTRQQTLDMPTAPAP
ncbi:aminopeptidase [Nevskia sp.]|uniref:aminopeptidase n=1 Tax=Nevskia sp. TaxID=1929292 RepID=UPI0025FCEE01|nr:aminopeptidase [Nevskia sp.]